MIKRNKFDLYELANMVLDSFPESMFKSKTTRFLDPCMGGGQFCHALEDRLRRYGHSDENISHRVHGFESVIMDIRFAVNKYKLVGQYSCVKAENFLKTETMEMKFDLVLQNPPYQTAKSEKGGANMLWRKFSIKAFDLVKDDGYVATVCPGFPWQSRDLKTQLVEENTPLILENNVREYFPGIGSTIKLWVVQKGKHNKDFVVDGHKFEGEFTKNNDPNLSVVENSIIRKMSKGEFFECKEDKMYTSSMLNKRDDIYVTKPDRKNKFPIRHASKIKVCYVPEPGESHYKKKVMMTYSGNPGFGYYHEKDPMTSCKEMSGYIEVDNKTQGMNLIKLYESKLYTARRRIGKTGAMHGWEDYTMAKVDIDKSWTDHELYKHFKLTKEEIEYVEANS